MSIQSVTGLVRLAIVTPTRRLEVAFPHHVPVVAVLPAVLRHGGDNLPDAGLAHEGWMLHRLDGSALDPGLAAGAATAAVDRAALRVLARRRRCHPRRPACGSVAMDPDPRARSAASSLGPDRGNTGRRVTRAGAVLLACLAAPPAARADEDGEPPRRASLLGNAGLKGYFLSRLGSNPTSGVLLVGARVRRIYRFSDLLVRTYGANFTRWRDVFSDRVVTPRAAKRRAGRRS